MEKKIDITVELQQERAMNQILRDTLKSKDDTLRHMKNIIVSIAICSSLVICIMICGFFWYESQFATTETTEYTEEMTTDGDNAYINNVEGSQYNDNANHTEGSK